MLKNKIYNYFFIQILKNFITILLTFAAIAWVVRAVNFLDLMVEDGFASSVYFQYSLLNITTIVSRFVPLAFLVSLTISIVKFERQQELVILWTSGFSKIKVANIFLLIAFFITLFQLILSLLVNPYLLGSSRFLLNNQKGSQINSILKSNEFSDSFKGITFHVDKKENTNELTNIFIKDVGGNLNTLISENNKEKNTTVIAKKGFIPKDKDTLILFDGIIQTFNKKNEIQNVKFEKTELSLNKMSTRTITEPKIQETSTVLLFKCIFPKDDNLNLTNCSKDNYKGVVVQNISRRIGMPLYVPLVATIISFLLLFKKENKYNFLKKYTLFAISFAILILSEVLLGSTSIYKLAAIFYFLFPLSTSCLLYIYLAKNMLSEKVL